MIIYVIAVILVLLSVLVIFFAVRSDDVSVRLVLAIISAIPWIALFIFLSEYKK